MIVKILWDDAGTFADSPCEESPWRTKEQIIELYELAHFTVISIGHIVLEDDENIVIAMSASHGDELFAKPVRIPKKLILQRIEL